ncbi:MAG: RecX family transcriptional regulator [Deltaproteobacteria bacterium]|nr:RecX family transcriptional regulator [Deltaproteobacteria bacterium]
MTRNTRNALSTALKFLSYRQRSVMEVDERLKKKGFGDDETGPVIEYLLDAGLLDDRKYASDLAASRARYKNWGPVKIAAELEMKGVSRESIEAALLPLKDTPVADAALGKWVKRNGVSLPLDKKTKERAFRFLKGRGFTTEAAIKALGALKGEDEL